MDPWSDVDVSSWTVEVPDPRGKRAKFWVRSPDGVLWLRKEPRERSPSEPAIETLMLRLARALGLPAPESAVCTWQTLPAITVRRGVLVRRFLDEGEELSLGSIELTIPRDSGYDPEHKGMHSLDRIRSVLATLELEARIPLLEPLTHMLAFDAWIGNADRHQENWGLLRRAGNPSRLAPVFDVASCLGSELDPNNALLRPGASLQTYIEKCGSGFGDGTNRRPLLPMAAVVGTLATWPEWQAGIHQWLADFAAAMDTFEEVVRHVPADWLSPERADLACNLLRLRLDWLRRHGE